MFWVYTCRTEEQIKVYYAANGKAPFTAKTAEAAAVVTGQDQQLTQQQQQLSKLSFPPKPSPAAFKAWFPGLGLSRTAASHPRAVIICFHRWVCPLVNKHQCTALLLSGLKVYITSHQ